MTIDERQPRVAGSATMPLIVCSTGAISRGPDATDDQLIDRWCPEIHADAFEIMFYDPWYGRSDEIATRIRDLDLPCVATHAERSIGPALVSDDPDERERAFAHLAENSRFTSGIGASVLVLHLWGLPDGDAKLDQQLEALPRLIDIAEAEGARLAIETIPCTVHTPLENLERVIGTDSRARVVLDTEFLSMHGQLDAALDDSPIWDDDRVVHIHVKDFDGALEDEDGRRRYLHPGEGSIPFGRWFSEVAARGYRGPISLESTVVGRAGEVDIDRLNRSLAKLRQLVDTAWTGE
jgi:sugar phosphate isomerase/epimerase